MRLALAVAAVLLAMTACTAERSAITDPSPPPEASRTATDEGVQLTLTLDPASVRPGGSMRATVEVRNVGDDPVTWLGGGCDIPARVVAHVPAERVPPDGVGGRSEPGAPPGESPTATPAEVEVHFRWDAPGDGPVACTQELAERVLEPGGKLAASFTWDGTAGEGRPVDDGPVTVEAVFPRGDIHDGEEDPVRVSVSARVEG